MTARALTNCPIGLDAHPELCSAGTCARCRATRRNPPPTTEAVPAAPPPATQEGLAPCPNPLHVWKIGPLLIGWQIAEDYWALYDASDNPVRCWASIQTVRARDGDEKLLNFTLLKLSLSFGWQRGRAPATGRQA